MVNFRDSHMLNRRYKAMYIDVIDHRCLDSPYQC